MCINVVTLLLYSLQAGLNLVVATPQHNRRVPVDATHILLHLYLDISQEGIVPAQAQQR